MCSRSDDLPDQMQQIWSRSMAKSVGGCCRSLGRRLTPKYTYENAHVAPSERNVAGTGQLMQLIVAGADTFSKWAPLELVELMQLI